MANNGVPVPKEEPGFKVWHISEVYIGVDGPGLGIADPDDMVLDWDMGFFRVVGVDEVTGRARMEKWYAPHPPEPASDENSLLGVDVPYQNDSFLAYIDTSVTPHLLSLDSVVHAYGVQASYIKVFRGTDISAVTGQVVSAMYDGAGQYVGENIPFDVLENEGSSNRSIKTPQVGYTNNTFQNGEVLTAVTYDDLGYMVSFRTLLVKNTAFTRRVESGQLYVQGIYLKSPYVSSAEPNKVLYPTNTALADLPMTGVVQYSDGSTVEHVVNQDRFRLMGVNDLISNTQGQVTPLVAIYYLKDIESFYGANQGIGGFVTAEYDAITTPYQTPFGVKLFGYPRWVDTITNYVMDYYLYTLDRSRFVNVTDKVKRVEGSAAFVSNKYGTRQDLQLYLDLTDVDPAYPTYRHTQTLGVTLLKSGTTSQSPQNFWNIRFATTQTTQYGVSVEAKAKKIATNNWQIRVGAAATSDETWLQKLYYSTLPLVHDEKETAPPRPNMFIVMYGGASYEYPLSRWNDVLSIPKEFKQGDNVYVRFIQRTYGNDLQLAIAALSVHVVTTL